jgi:TetR/AcrR family transcriptional regulator, regulator of mycofactocin system
MSDHGRTDSTGQSLATRLRVKRSEMMASELERTALRIFEDQGFENVTVENIATEAHISVRTFYRYFPTKEDVFQRQIARRSEGLRGALSNSTLDEAPVHALRQALVQQIAAEDADLVRRWVGVIADTPSVVKGVLGGIQLHTQRVVAEFFGARLGLPSDALVPTMLAAAVQGVIQAAHVEWYVHGGDLSTVISESLGVLEKVIDMDPRSWSTGSDVVETNRGRTKRRL